MTGPRSDPATEDLERQTGHDPGRARSGATEGSPLHRLAEYGQSYWLDNLARPMLQSGDLARRVDEEGLRGVTSNPAIFSEAIAGGDAYDDQIERLVGQRRSVQEIYEALTVQDVRDACDVLRPVFDRSDGADGFVSLEVSPRLARDTEGTVEEARRLYDAVDRPNVMIKIPGTEEGLPAIEQCLYDGLNINVTLLFSVERYEKVARAYLRALERRSEEGRPVEDVASVASFFLSRIDVLVDRLLGDRIRAGGPEDAPGHGRGDGPRPQDQLGRVAIANAKVAYRRFRRLFRGERWESLEAEGAQVQKLLWASTSTKDPLYSDVRYVEALVGPETVNTLPDRTIAAFADHGRAERTVDVGTDEAERVLEGLEEIGIDLARVTDRLEDEGIRKFVEPYDDLMATLARRRQEFLGEHAVRDRIGPGEDAPDLDGSLGSLDQRRFGRRLFAKDPSLWSGGHDEEEVIGERLGWLDAPADFWRRREEIVQFGGDIRSDDVDHVVWLGMGGSSLSAEVSRRVFGVAGDAPAFTMLDDTDPEAVVAAKEELEPGSTLFVVASKSGTTAETISLYRHFHDWVADHVGQPGRHFVAVTDPGTPLAKEAKRERFRRLFENPQDVGGRYSALTYFGLVAMALQGVDVEDLLACASQMRCSCGPLVPAAANPGLRLGAFLGQWARKGRDKVTLGGSPTLAPLATWLEQLLAESTGKDGVGLVPVAGEPLGEPGVYGDDRVFVHFRVPGEGDPSLEEKLDRLEDAGHPVVRIDAACDRGVGAEFYRWEVATATAGAVLGVNPFDEPNVVESKENTRRLLDEWERTGQLPTGDEIAREDGIAVYGDPEAPWLRGSDGRDLVAVLGGLLDTLQPGDYVAVLPYFRRTPGRHRRLQSLRQTIRDRETVATTLGYGPRYLHSTGQLHKGGPDTGVYLVLTAEPETDVAIPGADYGFGVLHRAQAVGDVRSLLDRGRRVVRFRLEGDLESVLARLDQALRACGSA